MGRGSVLPRRVAGTVASESFLKSIYRKLGQRFVQEFWMVGHISDNDPYTSAKRRLLPNPDISSATDITQNERCRPQLLRLSFALGFI
jgi:hypothetical protein